MLLGSEVCTVYFSLQDNVLVQSSHGWLIEEGDESGLGFFVLYLSIHGLSLKLSDKLPGQPTSLGFTVKAYFEVEG